MSQPSNTDDSDLAHQPRVSRAIWLSSVVVILGVAIAVTLTWYNLQPCSIAGLGTPCRSYRSWEEFLLVNIAALILVPVLCVHALPGEGMHLYGWWRPRHEAWRTTWLLYGFMLPVLFFSSRRPEFMAYYPMRPEAAYSWPFFLYHEATYGLYMMCWEFFFRGFLTFGLARGFGRGTAVVTQALIFGAMHYGKPWPEFVGSFAAGIALGWLALRARSFYPCFILHWACSVTFDVFVILARPDGLW